MTDESGSSQDESGLYDGRRRASVSKPLKRRVPPVSEILKSREKWDFFSASQNLASALNDPSNRETDLFTKTWGDYFVPHAQLPPTSIPVIEISDFLRYLKETASGRKSHRRIVRELNKSETPPSSPVSPGPIRQVQEGGRMYDLNSIPKIFSQKDFNLVDPRTFLQIIPLNNIIPNSSIRDPALHGANGGVSPHSPATTLQSTKLLHEKLTHYLDVVEVHLAHQISLKSDVFFSTLASQRQLELMILEVRQDTLTAKDHLLVVDKCEAHPILNLCQKCRQRKKLALVHDKLSQIANVHQTQQTIQLLLRTSDFVGALELIYRTQATLTNELGGIKSLRHLGLQLSELERAIENLMEADFVNFTMVDINGRVSEAEKMSPDGIDTEIQLESIVKGLLRQRKQKFLHPLREELDKSVRVKVKEIVEEYLNVVTDNEDEYGDETEDVGMGMSLGERLRAMDFISWYNLLDHTFSALLLYMRCVEKTLNVIIRTCQEEAGVLTPLTPTPLTTPTTPHPLRLPPELNEDQSSENKEVEFEDVVEHELEDRLDQLMMEDDLSDAHIEAMAAAAVIQETNDQQTKDDLEEKKLNNEQEKEPTQATTPLINKEVESHTITKEAESSTINEEAESSDQGTIDDGPILKSGECQELLFQCHELLSVVCDVIHSRCTKILNIRAKAGLLDNLVSSDFVRLVRIVGKFIDSSSGIIGRPCPHLQYALLSQAKKFLESFHDARRSKLNILLDGERWKQCDVPPEIQRVTQQLEEGKFISEEVSTNANKVLTTQTSTHAEQFLIIHNERFPVISVLLILIKMISDYCQIADDIPNLVTDVLSKLVDILKFFNSRTCQLVLGAGAVEMVGLKTITTRQLALVFRCLQAVMLLILDIKTHFRKRLTPKKCVLLQQFDQVQEDVGSHCREINQKINLIMSELFTRMLSKWEVKSPVPSHCFKVIIKQLIKLNESLSDIFPPNHLQALFQGLEDIFKQRLKSQLLKLSVTNNGSTEHGIVNAELTYMKGSLELLEHVTAFGNSLFDVWTINR